MTNNQSISQKLNIDLAQVIANTEHGDRLPSEPVLAKQLGVSRATLREAMRTFETQGMLYRRQGSGTYVTRPPQVIESGLEILESINTLAKRTGLSVSVDGLKIESRISTVVESESLGLASGSEILYVSRTILADGNPAAYLIDILPGDLILPAELEDGFNGSILDLLQTKDELGLTSSRCEINADTASPEVSRAMRIQRGDVLLRFIAYLYSSSGEVVDYSKSYFLPGIFRFHVVRRVG
jgi:GntR family transcriptional regulator